MKCLLMIEMFLLSEAFRAPAFQHGPDKNGFSLGTNNNFRQVFGEEKKYWLLPVFSRYQSFSLALKILVSVLANLIPSVSRCVFCSLGDGCSFPTCLVNRDPEQPSLPPGHNPSIKRFMPQMNNSFRNRLYNYINTVYAYIRIRKNVPPFETEICCRYYF